MAQAGIHFKQVNRPRAGPWAWKRGFRSKDIGKVNAPKAPKTNVLAQKELHSRQQHLENAGQGILVDIYGRPFLRLFYG